MLKKNYKIICNVVCAVLMVALLVLQFLPGYWSQKSDTPDKNGNYITDTTSLQGYIWMPEKYEVLDEYFKDLYGKKFELNQIILMPVVSLVFGTIGAVLALAKRRNKTTSKLGVLVGVIGVYGYLSHPIFQLNAMWIAHLVICILIALVGLTSVVISVMEKSAAKKKKASATA